MKKTILLSLLFYISGILSAADTLVVSRGVVIKLPSEIKKTVWAVDDVESTYRFLQDSLPKSGETVHFLNGSSEASEAVVGGTGIEGMRLTDTRPYLYAGYALPDFTLISALCRGGNQAGLIGAGFFGNDWTIVNGEFQWNTSSEQEE